MRVGTEEFQELLEDINPGGRDRDYFREYREAREYFDRHSDDYTELLMDDVQSQVEQIKEEAPRPLKIGARYFDHVSSFLDRLGMEEDTIEAEKDVAKQLREINRKRYGIDEYQRRKIGENLRAMRNSVEGIASRLDELVEGYQELREFEKSLPPGEAGKKAEIEQSFETAIYNIFEFVEDEVDREITRELTGADPRKSIIVESLEENETLVQKYMAQGDQ